MFFKVKCYIQSINNNNIQIYINDDNELHRFQKNLIKLYKNIDTFDLNNRTYNIKLLKTTKFDVNFKYNQINMLKGTSVIISGHSKYYCFSTNIEVVDESTNLFKTIKKINKGYTLYVDKIT